ncbi:MAG: LacI family DNA-binding transcriptional regulator [Roseitalea sp.]|jgi:LacI family transcriptional regulator|nr:LacI family DNA-binding transcriptional regulator [Roseitalea sp.]MBO6745290.1 LacI family DNA-binding transcriptional regulator [Roseitalea sp.]
MKKQTRQGGAKLVDVAKLARCSPATVSRVLNGNPKVGVSERERVMSAVTELGYVPNGSARALRSTRSRLAGAIIPTLNHAIYAAMVDGLESRLAESGVSLIINTSGYDNDIEFNQARLLVERGVESIVFVGANHHAKTLEMLDEKRVGYVFTYTNDPGETGAAIGFDNAKAGATGARFLHDLGHKKFAMIGGITKDNDRAQGRIDGFLSELEKLGHDRESVPVFEAPYDVESGRQAMESLMQVEDPATAVFCGSDILAAGAVKYCQAKGIDVPGKVSIMGFDNLEIAELTSPDLTTLEVPARNMGVHAADYTLADVKQHASMRQRELPLRLIVRGSTGARPD